MLANSKLVELYLLVEAAALSIEPLLRVDLEHVAKVVLLLLCTVVAEAMGVQAGLLEAHLNFCFVTLVVHHVTVLLHITLTDVVIGCGILINWRLYHVALLIHVLSLFILHAIILFDRICASSSVLLLDVVLDLKRPLEELCQSAELTAVVQRVDCLLLHPQKLAH